MKLATVSHVGSRVMLELRATKDMPDLDSGTLHYLHELGHAGASLRCQLTMLDGHLLLVLDQPSLEPS